MRQAVTMWIVGVYLVLSPFAQVSTHAADAAGTIAQAKRLIEAKDYSPATMLLEELLPDVNAADKAAILELLRQSYEALARQARAAGKERDAANFEDDLAIINRSGAAAQPAPKASQEKPKKPTAVPKPVVKASQPADIVAPTQPVPAAPNRALPAVPETAQPAAPLELTPAPPAGEPKAVTPDALPQLPKEIENPALDVTKKPSVQEQARSDASRARAQAPSAPKDDAAVMASKSPSPRSTPATLTPPAESTPSAPTPSLEEGDRLFTAGRYDEAGRCYAALARDNRLPAHRKVHWAYCRMVAVAGRINSRPRSAQEWEQITVEIANIQRLSPNIWYGEYLRNKVAEIRNVSRGPLGRSENLVVRGSEPDESQTNAEPKPRRLPRLFGKSAAAANTHPKAAPAPATPVATGELPLTLPGDSSQPTAPQGGADDRRADPVMAANAAAEQPQPVQGAGAARGDGDGGKVAWQVHETPNFRVYHQNARLAEAAGNAAESARTAQANRWSSPAAQRPWSPACDLYLYPNGKVFARETKQPENSPGFSTMTCNGNKIVARRLNLRADHPLLLTAILPHEVTHIVLADLFTDQQIPRWADEGMAVLAEPKAEQEARAVELQEPLEAGRVFDLRKLMAMDYPESKDWSLYYAQSVSLTRFLVERGEPEKFVRFVQDSQRDGIEVALQASYGLGGFAELEEQWTAYARQRVAPVKQARRDPGTQRAETEVK